MELRAVVLEGKFSQVEYKVGIHGIVLIAEKDEHIFIQYKNGDTRKHAAKQVFYIEY